MKLIRYLSPIWIGVLVYTMLSIGFGAKGISAYNQLKAERDRELANIEVLKSINTELEKSRESLSLDKDNFTVYARELGFAAPGELFIRIVGLGGLQRNISSPGQVVSPKTPEYTADRVLRILSVFISFAVLISIGIYDFLQYLKGRQ